MLIDNKKNGKIIDILKPAILKDSKLSFTCSYFTLYAFESLQKEFEKIDACKILLNNTTFKNNIQLLSSEKQEQKLKNNLQQTKIAKDFAQWLKAKAQIKEVQVDGVISFNLYHIANISGQNIAIQGSSNLSSSGLGTIHDSAFYINTLSNEQESTKQFLEIFNELWNNDSISKDIKQQILDNLELIYSDKSSQTIYFMILYHLFKDFMEDLDEEKIIKSKTGFKDTIVWNKLYNFQQDGVLGAIEKLEKHNGCIIADSVGLGKTFEALAVIKYYELRNDRVLVLAPKKLRENWTMYTINDKRNILANDRFNYDVLNHTDLSREKGQSGEINLATLNWENYDLIVIDESHNFRNTSTKKSKHKSRYEKLLEDVLKKGVKTKVLMLSATPVNNRLNDLKNQVFLITEGKDNSFIDFGINSVERTLIQAQNKFNKWLEFKDENRTTQNLLNALNFDYFKLLDLITIARSRKHIQKYYNTKDIGEFPVRLKPVNLKPDIDLQKEFPELSEINKIIRKLSLCAYSPLKYVMPNKKVEYEAKYDTRIAEGNVFKQSDRENSLIHLMRVNLLKRMESSINSFSLTVKKLLDKNRQLHTTLQARQHSSIEEMNIIDIDIDNEEFANELIGNNVKVLLQDVDKIKLMQDIQSDIEKLEMLYNESKYISSIRDKKLQELKNIIAHKISNPINPDNKKVIIFTAFADTAEYLYANIATWAKENYQIDSCIITGSGNNKTTLNLQTKELNELLTNFSPISKERAKIDKNATKEIDILIATDCISEGQNLQDCDFLINYDIHWNPVRIIQRFGRIDRLGSKNKQIQLVNFWANMELDEYINLESRVSGRMVLLDVSATGEENVIEANSTMNDLGYRAKQLKELQNQVLDLEDVGGGISITDLTLNDFRMDLTNYLKQNKNYIERLPTAIHTAIINNNEELAKEYGKGVIFCIKLLNTEITKTDNKYSLEPYYLIFIDEEENIKIEPSSPKSILDILKKLSIGNTTPNTNALKQLEQQTNSYANMSKYTSMLEIATQAIVGKKEESGLNSLFVRGGTNLSSNSFVKLEDIELIAYLVIL